MASRKGKSAGGAVKSIKLPPAVLALLTDEQKLALVQAAPTTAKASPKAKFDLKAAETEIVAEVMRTDTDERSTSLQVCKVADNGETRFSIRSFITSDSYTGPKSGVLMTAAEARQVRDALNTALPSKSSK